jgi:hypothetical protein
MSRCEIVSGDFFQSAPPADMYVLRRIIRDGTMSGLSRFLENAATPIRRRPGVTGRGCAQAWPSTNLREFLHLNMHVMAG